jgi:hypothetical protein
MCRGIAPTALSMSDRPSHSIWHLEARTWAPRCGWRIRAAKLCAWHLEAAPGGRAPAACLVSIAARGYVAAVFVRMASVLGVLAFLSASACSDRRSLPRSGDSKLMPFEVPMFDNQFKENRYIWAQLFRYIRSVSANDDVNFDSWSHIITQYNVLTRDILSFDYPPSEDFDWPDRELARSPEILHYKGARQNAVALGLLAFAIWRRDPKPERVTIEQLHVCANWKRPPGACHTSRRTRMLHRMMLMAEYADEDLFNKLRRQMPPPRAKPASQTRPSTTSAAPASARETTPVWSSE